VTQRKEEQNRIEESMDGESARNEKSARGSVNTAVPNVIPTKKKVL